MNNAHLTPAHESRLDALVQRHEALSKKIEDEMKYPALQDHKLKRLKLEKLKIKEQISFLKQE